MDKLLSLGDTSPLLQKLTKNNIPMLSHLRGAHHLPQTTRDANLVHSCSKKGYFTEYPFHVFLVLANELCERFSFYGMKAVLVFFLWKALGLAQPQATAIYHTFVVFCYATPLIGAMIADGWLGKYKTILFVSIIYVCGNILMTVSAIPFNGEFVSWICYVALLVIAFGTGGIKPCVSSFGGDQFKEHQTRQKDSFFSLFYLTINIGSMFSTILIPYIRGNVYCFGENCYALCFGIPAVLMIVSIILFVVGTRWYVRNPPGESILQRFFGCINTALSRKCYCCSSLNIEKKDHWLDYAAPDYDQNFIEDVKDVLRVTWLFLPLPVFWALFDQMGSKWAFQAQQMNGDFEGMTVYPDMIHFMNPLMVVIIVPILEYLVYPCLDKLHIPNRPLQRMTLGMFLAGTAFLVTSFLQIAVNSDQPAILYEGETKFQIINASPEPINVLYRSLSDDNVKGDYNISSLTESGTYNYVSASSYEFVVNAPGNNLTNQTFYLESGKAYQIFFNANYSLIKHHQPRTMLTEKGESSVRVFNGLHYPSQVLLKTTGTQEPEPRKFDMTIPGNVSNFENLIFADFKASYTDENNVIRNLGGIIVSKNGPVYILVLAMDNNSEISLTQIQEEKPWSQNIFLQTPQYIIMSLGECLFSVTGLGFAYSQASPSMKSILSAIWLMTVCFGNIIIIIVQGASGSLSAVSEFFLFTGLMYVTTVVFAIMTIFYKYVTPREREVETKVIEDNKTLGYENRVMNEYAETHEYVDINEYANESKAKPANSDDDLTRF